MAARIILDVLAPRKRVTLIQIGQAYGDDDQVWVIEPPRWFVSADTPLGALAEVLKLHGREIAARACNATKEAPDVDSEAAEGLGSPAGLIDQLRTKTGGARVLYAARVNGRPLPKVSRQSTLTCRATVAWSHGPQSLSFRYLPL